jgi:hypothetical protein
MTTIINGSSPSITFSDSTTQASAGLPLTGGTLSGALTVPTLNAPSGVLATQNGMTGIAKAWVNFGYVSSAGKGDYIKEWNHPVHAQPTQAQLDAA